MPIYHLPVFNLTVNIWRNQSDVGVHPPDVVTLGNLAWGRRVNVPAVGAADAYGVMTLLLPALTDIRDNPLSPANADFVEVPAGSGRIYGVIVVDDMGKGFANEHRAAVIQKTSGFPWPNPIP